MTAAMAETLSPARLDRLAINAIRFLVVDAVQHAGGGHLGMPMGMAPVAYVLWTRFLRHDPAEPTWFDRDRFVLSSGHGSALLYAMLHLTGYDLMLEDLKQFRQWGSRAPGLPDRRLTPGVELSTGLPGQGFAAAVGLAMAEEALAARYNRLDLNIIHHSTYCIIGDGDVMEGVAAEAASLAGHLRLGKLLCLYDDNRISRAGATRLAFSEDVAARFRAYGWHTTEVDDVEDLEAIDGAIHAARAEADRPSLIIARTHIGRGLHFRQDTFEAHGGALPPADVRWAKEDAGWPVEPPFYVPREVEAHFRSALGHGQRMRDEWRQLWSLYQKQHPEQAVELQRRIEGRLPPDWTRHLPRWTPDDTGMSTCEASEKTLLTLGPRLPSLLGGAADFEPSSHSVLRGAGDFENASMAVGDRQGSAGGGWSYAGRNIHFGAREHVMGAVLNGLAAHGAFIPYGATALAMADYLRPAIRAAACMGLGAIYLLPHDNTGTDADGSLPQPVEQLATLRAIPNLVVVRPCDANETVEAWRVAIGTRDRPVVIVLTHQVVSTLDRQRMASADGLRRGAYVLRDTLDAEPRVVLLASGPEVMLGLGAQNLLATQGVPTRVVSMPCWELFEEQTAEYRESVLPTAVTARVVIEAGSSFGWHRHVGERGRVLTVDRFEASEALPHAHGLSVEAVVQLARETLQFPWKSSLQGREQVL